MTTLIVLLIILSLSTIYFFLSGPKMTPEIEAAIDKAYANPLPEIIRGQAGFADSNGVKIWYECNTPPGKPKGTVVIILGITCDAFIASRRFIDSFLEEGYQVIRYDQRGTGLSDWMEHWTPRTAYDLKDMGGDVLAILDQLHIEKAHVLGISMGAMIAQELAIHHPNRIASLISIMSTGYLQDPKLPKVSKLLAAKLMHVNFKYRILGGERNLVRMRIAIRMVLRGKAKYPINVEGLPEKVLYNLRKRRGYNPKAAVQHYKAMLLSGSRYENLKKLGVPTLVIHGKQDPFIPIEHGVKCAKLIPHASGLWVDEMGHDIAVNLIDTLKVNIVSHFEDVRM